MTTEKILAKLYDVVESFNEEDKEKFDIFMSREREFADACKKSSLPSKLSVLIFDLEEDFRREEAKKAGKNAALTAAKRILKNAKKKTPRTEFYYARDTEDGQFIADGYRMVLLKETDKLPLEPMPENVKAEFDYKRCIPSDFEDEIALPDIKALKTALKLNKARYPKEAAFFYDFGKNLPVVNAEYLLDVTEIIGAESIKCNGELKPAVMENTNGSIGIIMPVIKEKLKGGHYITAEDLK